VNALSAVIITLLGLVCALGTVWWALRAERTYGADPHPEIPPAEPGWWEGAEWWPALSADEQQWVLRNLADAGHPAADAALDRTTSERDC
jgi:hypothetical protein